MNRHSAAHECFFIRGRFHRQVLRRLMVICAPAAVVFIAACGEFEKPQAEPFYAQTKPPVKQEFRWSNGKMAKSLDPARAAAPPETDVVRAIFEGLTEIDPKTLHEVPAAAEKWATSEDLKTWTFFLRENAKWSNGKPVTADDFVRSWRRLAEMGQGAAHPHLLNNIAGLPLQPPVNGQETAPDFIPSREPERTAPPVGQANSEPPVSSLNDAATRNSNTNTEPARQDRGSLRAEPMIGIKAISERVLQVTLNRPDKDFPKLVANPIFRPIYGEVPRTKDIGLDAVVVTNGAFRVSKIDRDGVTLGRSDNYWNRNAIRLETVRFVPMESAEKALEAYRAGELDAMSNAEFAPLALKLLTPYADFRKTTHSALNFYEVNVAKPPFTDRRVREALSIAIERERLTEGELEGTTQPALSFMPFGVKATAKLTQDKERARELLDEAGYPDGENFPVIRLLVNRNETQQRVARVVAAMWKQNLNLESEIIVKEPAELEAARETGDFDIVRRGVVLPTSDEAVNFMSIFGFGPAGAAPSASPTPISRNEQPRGTPPIADTESDEGIAEGTPSVDTGAVITNEEDALYELRAIPLYFPTSYSLVKPYVSGFEMNSLDAPSLWHVVIDNDWQPKKTRGES